MFISIASTQMTDLHRFFDKFHSVITKLKSLKISMMNVHIFNMFYSTLLIN
ncbi:hypothetical protein EMPG_13058 [Blastomyces silverae]|uniref:Uncharacterized protein n=1 Tax=Blastomyces silverae TaxID=2060906 RepID=A0A0H1BL11_9EURO|nr:hypothetical protein EMPG_13058 [Blastomyces silverae]